MTLRLHSFPLSGHAHRARLMLALLGLEAETVDVDLRGGAQKQPDFLGLNAFGQVPVLEDGEPENPVVIADSNAILVYLAGKYDRSGQWLPADPAIAAQVQRWLSVAAGQLLMGPARARMVKLFSSPFDHDACRQVATQLFHVMERHLQGRDWLAASHATIADIALYSYTAHAPEGDVSLQPYPHIRGWIRRVETLPGFVPMQKAA
ncbi:glutathione S-transferase [Ferrovibrio terrae]|uniref:Glutathione S-transferase n=1 Tax=Ferrovibrio terrae TaxID=2594003 RepID=A0A516GZK8_9PROT|nr:glutathione S-transferase [Ferrovibrio terrae]QDO96770.1 glutathione S-transferase [Ferrovibrio terrae]